ncbi:hypothetical protein OIE68_21080 [Nocardia vinacea]|nr:hypothetical protein OIE68_21080 [Nocardia vinacea]
MRPGSVRVSSPRLIIWAAVAMRYRARSRAKAAASAPVTASAVANPRRGFRGDHAAIDHELQAAAHGETGLRCGEVEHCHRVGARVAHDPFGTADISVVDDDEQADPARSRLSVACEPAALE